MKTLPDADEVTEEISLYQYAEYGARVVCSKMASWMRGGIYADIRQEAFIRLSNVEDFYQKDEKVRRKVAFHCAYDACRRNPRMLSCMPMRRIDGMIASKHNCVELGVDLESELVGTAQSAAGEMTAVDFAKFLRRLAKKVLSRKLYRVVDLRILRGWSRKETAKKLGVQPKTIGEAIAKASRILREELALRGYSESDCFSAMGGLDDGSVLV